MLKRQKSLFSSRAYWQIINGTNLLIDETVYARTEYVLTCVIAQMCMLSCIAQCCEHSCTVFWLFCCFLDNGFSESEEACFLFSPQRSWSEPTCLIRYRTCQGGSGTCTIHCVVISLLEFLQTALFYKVIIFLLQKQY